MRQPAFSRAVLGLSLGLGGGVPAAAQTATLEPGGAAFLLVPVGARAAALGQAAVAIGGTGESAFWNPAGLADMEDSEVAIHRANTFASNNTVLAAYLVSSTLGTVGIAGYLVDFGSQDVIAGAGRPTTGRLSPRNVEVLASYATDVAGSFTVGVNYKLIQFRQDCSGDCTPFRTVVGTTHGVDVGVQYGFGDSDAFRVGATLLHAGFKLQVQNRGQADPLPTRVQVGAAYRVRIPTPPESVELLDAHVSVDLQERWGEYQTPDARVGVELAYGEMIRIRTGYAFLHAESAGPSIGLGFQFGRLALDFARTFYESSSLQNPVYLSLRALL